MSSRLCNLYTPRLHCHELIMWWPISKEEIVFPPSPTTQKSWVEFINHECAYYPYSQPLFPLSHYNDQGLRKWWPILIYHLQSHRRWEVNFDPDKKATTTSASSDRRKTNAAANKLTKGGYIDGSNSDGHSRKYTSPKDPCVVEELMVDPCQGCIEVHKMCLWIQLFQQHMTWDPNQQHQCSQACRG